MSLPQLLTCEARVAGFVGNPRILLVSQRRHRHVSFTAAAFHFWGTFFLTPRPSLLLPLLLPVSTWPVIPSAALPTGTADDGCWSSRGVGAP